MILVSEDGHFAQVKPLLLKASFLNGVHEGFGRLGSQDLPSTVPAQKMMAQNRGVLQWRECPQMFADERFPRKRCQQMRLRPYLTRAGAQDYDSSNKLPQITSGNGRGFGLLQKTDIVLLWFLCGPNDARHRSWRYLFAAPRYTMEDIAAVRALLH